MATVKVTVGLTEKEESCAKMGVLLGQCGTCMRVMKKINSQLPASKRVKLSKNLKLKVLDFKPLNEAIEYKVTNIDELLTSHEYTATPTWTNLTGTSGTTNN